MIPVEVKGKNQEMYGFLNVELCNQCVIQTELADGPLIAQ